MEELNIPEVLGRLEPYRLGPVERVLAAHTGTVQLLLSLYFGSPVDVTLVEQSEKLGEIQRRVSLVVRCTCKEACFARSVIPLSANKSEVLVDVRQGRLGIGQIVFSPLAQGVLTGKYLDGPPAGSRATDAHRKPGMERHLERVAAVRGLRTLADELGTTPARLALAWTLRGPAVASAIFGATRPEQVRDNLAALELSLTPEVLARLDAEFPPA